MGHGGIRQRQKCINLLQSNGRRGMAALGKLGVHLESNAVVPSGAGRRCRNAAAIRAKSHELMRHTECKCTQQGQSNHNDSIHK